VVKPVILIYLLSVFTLLSQGLNIFNIDTRSFPTMKASIFMLDSAGSYVNLLAKDISLVENGNTIKNFNLDCTNSTIINKLSTVVLLDVSESMKSNDRILSLRQGVEKWINIQNYDEDEVALVGFSDKPYIISDFSNNKQSLLRSIFRLPIQNGTNFNRALLENRTGGLRVVQGAKNQAHMIIITDGVGQINIDSVLNESLKRNVIIHCISIELNLPEDLKLLSRKTGGLTFEFINRKSDIESAVQQIYNLSKVKKYCNLQWESGGCLIDRELQIVHKPTNATIKTNYKGVDSIVPKFIYSPNKFTYFTQSFNQKEITITAVNGDIEVENIISEIPSFSFSWLDSVPNPKFILKKDKSFRVLIKVTPSDSTFQLNTFSIIANTCSNSEFYATSGSNGFTPKKGNLKIVYPNGGEILFANSEALVTWKGTIPDDKITIENSTNRGKSWRLITDQANGFNYKWSLPNIESVDNLVRVTQYSKSIGKQYLSINTDSININSVDWSSDGNKIAAGAKDSSVFIYDAINGERLMVNKYHNAQVKAVKWSPDGIRLISGGDDSVAYIYDTFANEVTDTIRGFGGEINCIDWNSGGNSIVFGCSDKSVYIQKFSPIKKFERYQVCNKAVTSVRFDKSGDKIAVVSRDSLVRIINVFNGLVINTLTDPNVDGGFSHKGEITSTAFNETGDKIATGSKDGLAKVWDLANTRGVITLYQNHNSGILSLDWSWTSDLIASCGVDGRVNVWSSKGVDKFNFGNNWTQNSVRFSPDGSRLVVGTDGIGLSDKINLYSIDVFPFQQATSDSTFAIIKPNIETIPIQFDKVKIGQTKEIIVKNFFNLKNLNSIFIDSISVSNSVFSVSPFRNILIQKNDSSNLSFVFKPKNVKVYNDNITFYTNIGKIVSSIIGEGIEPNTLVNDLDLGIIELNTNEVFNLELKNNTNTERVLDSIENYNDNFIFNNKYNQFFESNESKTLTGIFTANQLGLNSDIVKLNFEDEIAETSLFANVQTVKLLYDTIINVKGYNCQNLNLFEFEITNVGEIDFKIDSAIINSNIVVNKDRTVLSRASKMNIKFSLLDSKISYLTDTLRLFHKNKSIKNPLLIPFKLDLDTLEFEYTKKTELMGLEPNESRTFTIPFTNKTNSVLNIQQVLPFIIDDYFSLLEMSNTFLNSNATTLLKFEFKGGEVGKTYKAVYSLDICSNSSNIELEAVVKSNFPKLKVDSLIQLPTLFCDDSISSTKFKITNTGKGILKIDSIKVNGNKNLSVTNLQIPLIINENNSTDLTINLNIPKPIIGQDTINIYSNSNENGVASTKQIIIVKYSKITSIPILDKKEINFNYNNLGQLEKSSLKFNILNFGNNLFKIKDIVYNLDSFDINYNVNRGGDSTIFDVKYKLGMPAKPFISQIKIIDSCNRNFIVTINIAPSNTIRLKVEIANSEVSIGGSTDVKIKLFDFINLFESQLPYLDLNFVVNRKLLYISPNSQLTETNVNETHRTIRLRLPINNNTSESIETYLKLNGLWGDSLSSELSLISIVTDTTFNKNIYFTSNNSRVAVIPYCEYPNSYYIDSNLSYTYINGLLKFNNISKNKLSFQIFDINGGLIHFFEVNPNTTFEKYLDERYLIIKEMNSKKYLKLIND